MQRIGLTAIAATMIVGGLVATPAHAAATCFGERATIVGNERDNEINGTAGRDVIVAGGGDDIVHGQGGNDLICGGTGEDNGLYGDAGNDRIHAGTSERTSLLYGGRGDDYLYDEPGGGDGQVMFGGPGDDVLKAGDSNGTYNDELDGGPGNDVMEQGEGEGLLYEGPGNDVIWGGGGNSNDQLYLTDAPAGVTVNMARGTLSGWGGGKVGEIEVVMGSRFDDTITGDGDGNFLIGAGGDDVISGGSARDCLMGGAIEFFHMCYQAYQVGRDSGNDVLSGDGGDDQLIGGDGNDRYSGGIGVDRAWFGASRTAVEVNVGRGTATGEGKDSLDADVESVVGSKHTDTLTGSAGPDELIAGPGGSTGDVVRGLDGDDVLGVQGDARADGGPGNDTVTYEFTPVTMIDLRSDSDSNGNTLANIENVFGSNWSTGITIHGDEGPNTIGGSAGPDEIFGYGGDDALDGRFGDDRIDGGEGTDTIDGGPSDQNDDNDTCVNGETVEDCEA